MNLARILFSGVLAGVITLSAGCSWFESDDKLDPANTNSSETIPKPGELGPIAGSDTDIAGPTGFTNESPEVLAAGTDNFGEPIPGLNFPTIYFAYDQDQVGASERVKLEKVADYMTKYAGVGVIIEGHCDERGSAEYNRALGERRALAVKQYLVNLGVPDARLKTISYGEERPAAMGTGASIWTKNRRAELVPVRMK